jgi:hypothetical protein
MELAPKLGIKNFKVVMHNDLIGKKMAEDDAIVVNLDRRPNGSGSHYVCLIGKPNSKDVYYFDSYGVPPSNIIRDFIKKSGRNILYNDSEIQAFDSVMCGFYCLYFLKGISAGKDVLDVLYKFKQEPVAFNEKLIRKFGAMILE